MPKRHLKANHPVSQGEYHIEPLRQFCWQLRHRCVRDLAFSVYSETLLHTIQGSSARPYALPFDDNAKAWLIELDTQPRALIAHLATRTSTRLGLYFESLWAFYWLHMGGGRLLAHNLQLNRRGKTLGALDFVIEDAEGTLQHIEAAAKFYLANPKPPAQHGAESPWQSSHYDWIGPNANDRLAWKLEHMCNHQLPLSASPEALAALSERLGGSPVVCSSFLIRGCLFWPAMSHELAKPLGVEPTEDINRQANAGIWWHLADFLAQESVAGCEAFSVLPRNHWLAPACYPSALVPLTLPELKQALLQQITLRGQGLMVVGLVRGSAQWRESQRLFVVPDHWPGTARPSRRT
ncbi:DUF1853 family protein [Gilvimarinus agarilyticus]|uniref:DUF1853 family protein n=1 Tax=Gilvimarinus agarilyticus TaxID=679259 RepID=UPI0005A06792|nr:DUF1853 family protein [Gilvimarinus agarilyticus]